MSQNEKQTDHLHANQDDVGDTHEPQYGEQQFDKDESGERDTGEHTEHGKSVEAPFGHDEVGPEPGVDVEGEAS
jgi:hypothetical protein